MLKFSNQGLHGARSPFGIFRYQRHLQHLDWRIKLTYRWAGQRSSMRVHDIVLEVRFTARAGAFHIVLASATSAACARLF